MRKFLSLPLMAAVLFVGGCVPVEDAQPAGDEVVSEYPAEDSTVGETVVTDTEEDATELLTADVFTISAQKPGSQFWVDKVTLSKAGYVVIHENTAEDTFGEVVGSSQLLSAGESTAVAVTLTKEAKAGEWYWAMLHMDNGDGVYEYPGPDGPIADEAGNVVMVKFEVKE